MHVYEREEVQGDSTEIDNTEEKDIDLPLPEVKQKKERPDPNRWTSRQLAQKILKFIPALGGVELYPYQKNFAVRVILAVIENDGETLTALFSRQSGKTETIANVVSVLMVLLPRLGSLPNAHTFLPKTMFDQYGRYMYREGFWVGIFAPVKEQAITTYDRIRDRLMNEQAIEILHSAEFRVGVNVNNGNTCAITNGSFVRCHSASDGSNIESKTYHMVIIEESQDVSDFKVNKCVTGDTLMTMSDGRRIPISEVKEGEMSVAFDRVSWRLVPSEIVEVHRNGVKPIYEIETASGAKIRATDNHQFLTFTRGHKTVKTKLLSDIDASSDRVMLAKNHAAFGSEPIGVPLAKIIGYILGDGNVTGCNIAFCAYEQEIKDDFEYACVEYGMPASIRNVRECERGGTLTEYQISNKSHGNKNPLISYFKEIGLWGTHGKDKRIPSVIFTAPKEEVAATLGALFASDGCVSIYEDSSTGRTRASVTYASISRGLVEDMQDLLLRFGVVSRISTRANKGGFGGDRGRDLHTLSIQDSDSLFRLSCNVEIPSKQGRLNEAALLSLDRESRVVVNKELGAPVETDVFFDRIKSITYVGEEETFCVTVAHKDHITRFGQFVTPQSIAPMTASTNGPMVFIGTANNRKGFFLNQISQNKKREAAEGIKNHFEYDYRVAAKYNKQYAKKIKQEMNRLGYDSDEFKMAYRLIWILERGMFVTEDEFIGNADSGEYNKCAKPYEIIPHPQQGKVYVGGLDVAKQSDQTVLTIMEVDYDNPVLIEMAGDATSEIQVIKQYQKRIACWVVMQGNWEYQYEALKEEIDKWNLNVLCIDSTGVGDPLADRLMVNLDTTLVIPYKFTIPSKSVMWKNLSQEIAHRRLEFPYGPKSKNKMEVKTFIDELLNLEKSYVGQYMVCQHPNTRNSHDDFCDSLALACMAAKEEGVADIEVLDHNPFFSG